jgi:hypothetical protein
VTYFLSGLGIVLLAAGYHGVTEHHWHLKYFWRFARPGTVIPPTRHDTRWHSMSHASRAGVDVVMVLAAAGLGLALRIWPRAALTGLVIGFAVVITAGGVRAISRSFSGRRHYGED